MRIIEIKITGRLNWNILFPNEHLSAIMERIQQSNICYINHLYRPIYRLQFYKSIEQLEITPIKGRFREDSQHFVRIRTAQN